MTDQTQQRRQVGGGRRAIGDVAPKLAELTDDVLFDDVWNRPGLAARDRSLVTVAALVAGGDADQLRFHLDHARKNGLTEDRAGRGDHPPRVLRRLAQGHDGRHRRQAGLRRLTPAPRRAPHPPRHREERPMKATLMYEAGDVRVEEVPDPMISEPTEALVRVTYACVCGSDLHPYHDLEATPEGRRMGHEAIGVVQEVGADVTTLRSGDTVIVPFAWSDGTCAFCRDGITTSCVHGGFFDGAPSATQAELLIVPQADGTAVRSPRGPTSR